MENSAGRLYKTITFHHAVQLLETGQLYLARPDKWEDPYETRVAHPDFMRVYAQCWCVSGVSDAMWRIYSPHHLGVRIGTSSRKLKDAVKRGLAGRPVAIRADEVTYLSPYELTQRSRTLHRELRENGAMPTLKECTDFLFMKREAYSHEKEYRLVAIDHGDDFSVNQEGLRIDVDPHQLIDSILIDPRAPKELADALTYYFREKIGFRKKCKQSALYKKPHALTFVDEEDA